MIDRCNISMRQAWDVYSILSLFFFNYVTQEEPFPCLPLDYELCRPLSYWAMLPEAKNPHRGTMLMSDFTDRELTLIKQWEIHFQRTEAACGDKTTLQVRGWRHGDAYEAGCTRDGLFTHTSAQICVYKHWCHKLDCLCESTKRPVAVSRGELCNMGLYEQLIGSWHAFFPAGG